MHQQLNAAFEAAFTNIFGAAKQAAAPVAAPSLNAPAAPRADVEPDRIVRTHRTLQRGGGVHLLRGKDEAAVYAAALALKDGIDFYRMPSIEIRREDPLTGDFLAEVRYKSLD